MRYFRKLTRKKDNVEQHEQMIVAAELRKMDVFFTSSIAGVNVGPRIGKLLKDSGYRSGTPDLMIFEPRGPWLALFIEMKRPALFGKARGRISDEQVTFKIEAEKRGYKAVVCYGSCEALTFISHYLNQQDTA